MSIEINTTEYQFSHGKMPRGYGYWAFQIGNDPQTYWKTGKYAEAVKDARALAVSKKAVVVKVLP